MHPPCTPYSSTTEPAPLDGMKPAESWLANLPPLQFRTFSIITAGEHEVSANANAGHKRREESGRELHGGSVGTCRNDFVDTSAVMLEVFLSGEVQVENKVVHGWDVIELVVYASNLKHSTFSRSQTVTCICCSRHRIAWLDSSTMADSYRGLSRRIAR